VAARDELKRLQRELTDERRRAGDKEIQLERYASDLRETFKAERARVDELRRSYVATVRALTNAVEARDAYTGKHAERVAAYGLELARRVDPAVADDPQTEFGYLLHDVGKVAIPDAILDKPGPLDDEEWVFMRRHTVIGERIVAAAPALSPVAKLVRASHERWDGTGYPDAIGGQDIPLGARIIAVCDAYDAMVSDRPYRRGRGAADATAELRRCAGTQFDPAVVEAFVAELTAQPLRSSLTSA
jgi:HD-GYP domain-containing protein (c-di-GMP phosphodiesterase class II)